MPRFDGTGPKGEGPKTGRGLGKCDLESSKKIEGVQEENLSISKVSLFGRRFGLGRKNGRGFRNRGE